MGSSGGGSGPLLGAGGSGPKRVEIKVKNNPAKKAIS